MAEPHKCSYLLGLHDISVHTMFIMNVYIIQATHHSGIVLRSAWGNFRIKLLPIKFYSEFYFLVLFSDWRKMLLLWPWFESQPGKKFVRCRKGLIVWRQNICSTISPSKTLSKCFFTKLLFDFENIRSWHLKKWKNRSLMVVGLVPFVLTVTRCHRLVWRWRSFQPVSGEREKSLIW